MHCRLTDVMTLPLRLLTAVSVLDLSFNDKLTLRQWGVTDQHDALRIAEMPALRVLGSGRILISAGTVLTCRRSMTFISSAASWAAQQLTWFATLTIHHADGQTPTSTWTPSF